MKCEALLGTAVPSLNMASASTVALAERVYDFTLSHPSAAGMVEHSVTGERSTTFARLFLK